MTISDRNEGWRESLAAARDAVALTNPLQVSGQLVKATGLVMEAVGLRLPVGSTCVIELPHHRIEAEVVGFAGER
ncbi:flagellar protein export ATPase FliI, partial [mine drainage metagenome]